MRLFYILFCIVAAPFVGLSRLISRFTLPQEIIMARKRERLLFAAMMREKPEFGAWIMSLSSEDQDRITVKACRHQPEIAIALKVDPQTARSEALMWGFMAREIHGGSNYSPPVVRSMPASDFNVFAARLTVFATRALVAGYWRDNPGCAESADQLDPVEVLCFCYASNQHTPREYSDFLIRVINWEWRRLMV